MNHSSDAAMLRSHLLPDNTGKVGSESPQRVRYVVAWEWGGS